MIDKHLASLGYSTCFWHTMRHSIPLFDRQGWFAALKNRCQVDYPEALRRNIIAHNHPVLRSIIPSYASQIEKAVKRHDLVSINHRLAALFASYFDILFALNRQLHPGEKRLLTHALSSLSKLPEEMEVDITAVLKAAAVNIAALPDGVYRLLDRLDQALQDEGLLPE